MISSSIHRHLLAALLLALFALPVQAQENVEFTNTSLEVEDADIISTLASEGNYSVLLASLKKTGLDKALKEKGPFTLFAPTDEAFDKLPEGTLDELTDEELTTLLQHHVVIDELTSDRALSLGTAMLLNGESVEIKKTTDGSVMIDNATLVAPDIKAGNGMIHGIDKVLGSPAEETLGKVGEQESPKTTDSKGLNEQLQYK